MEIEVRKINGKIVEKNKEKYEEEYLMELIYGILLFMWYFHLFNIIICRV
jgi:hypothetical protein